MLYRSVVKYAVDSSDAEKLGVLYYGLQEIVSEMIDDHGVSLAYVEGALDEALMAAQDAYSYRVEREGE